MSYYEHITFIGVVLTAVTDYYFNLSPNSIYTLSLLHSPNINILLRHDKILFDLYSRMTMDLAMMI